MHYKKVTLKTEFAQEHIATKHKQIFVSVRALNRFLFITVSIVSMQIPVYLNIFRMQKKLEHNVKLKHRCNVEHKKRFHFGPYGSSPLPQTTKND